MKVFLETSLLSDTKLKELSEEIVQARSSFEFRISVLTHFQILWGYTLANRSDEKYDAFIKRIGRVSFGALSDLIFDSKFR